MNDEFDRAVPVASNTMAYQRFAADFTTLNSYYWGAVSSITAVSGVMNHLSDQDDFRSKLGLVQKRFDRPLNHISTHYLDELKTSEKWHRRTSLVALLSAFERYMASVTALAAASDPSLRKGFPKLVEGLSLLKHGVTLGERDLVGVVKGTWAARIVAFERLFGENAVLSDALGELEKMRNSRNRIAHAFAASELPSALTPHAALIIGTRRLKDSDSLVSLSEKMLLSWFELVNTIVKSVDEQLLNDFIGNYEIPAMYLEWSKDPASFERDIGISLTSSKDDNERRAKKFLNGALHLPALSRGYVKSIISFTEGL